MAVIHQAFTFDVDELKDRIREELAPSGQLDITRLGFVAREFVTSSNSGKRHYLSLICFDNEWLADGGSDTGAAADLFLVYLGHFLGLPTTLTNLSFAALENTLPLADWSSESVRLLLVGRSLRVLTENVAQFKGDSALDKRYVSWMSAADVKYLRARMLASRQALESPSPAMSRALTLFPSEFLAGGNPEAIIRSAYAEAMSRLSTALDRQSGLLLINDTNSYSRHPGPDPIMGAEYVV